MNPVAKYAVPLLAAAAVGLCAAAPLAAEETRTVVTVNGTSISAASAVAEYHWILNQKKMVHPIVEGRLPGFRAEALDRLIVWELIRQKLAAEGKAAGAEDVDAEIAAKGVQWGDKFEEFLKVLGQTEATYRNRTEGVLNYRTYLREHLIPKVEVSQEEIRRHWDERGGKFEAPARFSVETLQVFTPHRGGSVEELRDTVRAVHRQLVDGATFQQALEAARTGKVKARTTEETLEIGSNRVYDPFLRVLEEGQVSNPIPVTENSYTIIRLREKTDAKVLSYEEAKPQIRDFLSLVKLQDDIGPAIEALKNEATIVYPDGEAPPGGGWQ